MVYGANTKEGALEIQRQLNEVLPSAGFVLKKWTSNDVELMLSVDSRSSNLQHINFSKFNNSTVKTLGLSWNIHNDEFIYSLQEISTPEQITKRNVLSVTAKLFDPLGLLSPVIVKAKMFMQQLWLMKVDCLHGKNIYKSYEW